MSSLRVTLLWNTVRMAFEALARYPLRAALTTFGILVGVLAVTVTVALGEGARLKVSAQVDKLGSNALVVQPLAQTRSGAVSSDDVAMLTEADGGAIRREASAIAFVSPLLGTFSQLQFGGENVNAEVVGTTLDYFSIRDWTVESGMLWDDQHQNTGARVCVIGRTVVDELFGDVDPVGRVIRVGRQPFRVLGVMEAKGQDAFGRDEDSRIWVPIRAARAKLKPAQFGQVDSLLISARSQDASARAEAEIRAVLRQRHGLVEGVDDDFRIRSQTEFRQVQERVLGILSLLLVSVAVVSLVVGGIGIMNIMLVSVSERTREIGIRLAIGARKGDVLVQFLIEALVLSVLGGAAGAAVATLAVVVLGQALELPMRVSPPALAGAFVTSVVIGVVFGFVPARRAAQLDVIDALRSE
jgi:putative ABC transport system permease protein